jgi:hypothetical protein
MHAILKKLTGGTRRSLGRTNEVVAEVLARPSLFRHLFAGLTSNDEVLRMRAADAIEKITIPRPDLLTAWVAEVVEEDFDGGGAFGGGEF